MVIATVGLKSMEERRSSFLEVYAKLCLLNPNFAATESES